MYPKFVFLSGGRPVSKNWLLLLCILCADLRKNERHVTGDAAIASPPLY